MTFSPDHAEALVTVPEVALPVEVEPRVRSWRWLKILLGTLLALAFLTAAGMGFVISRGGWYEVHALTAPALPPLPEKEAAKQEKLARRIAELAPRGTYVFIDTYANRVRVLKNGELLREAVCSTGSGTILKDPEKGREWVFDTPRGERKVQRKVRNPVWVKPDWAFIEEGYQPPARDSPDRYDDFSLGDYGLYLGDGYIIHGTIFQSLLGQRVTHGCIRLGDKDLEFVYKSVPLGAKVYLY